MQAPVRIEVTVKGPNSVKVRWYDPTLAADQLIRDRRYYTVRYHSFSIGQYVYVNVTDMPARIENLRAATDYKFTVRVNDPPYLSEWSEEEQATTASQYITKAGECPAVDDDTAGICVEECRADGDCDGAEKCCSNGL
ncbi:hypothetical protein DPMN_016822 [Dreissena polymorpha]|uniref:Fibronectin type-III domain-containing protein n=1 Tax=Dreissena polymorpha TaxID=45954 RepID=A0A9D4S7J0_DREPO|nr:hypothetical protein DPMN_016822 [Dreissena polymorpha]